MMRVLEVVRVGYGLAMLIAPEALVGRGATKSSDKTVRRVVRVLGARHLVQGIALFSRDESWHRAGAIVDVLHCLTASIFAAVVPRWRRPAAVSALVSLVFGAGEFR
jgi:hypothetical protein